MARFKDKYRIESTRLKGYNYSSPGWYFVTICTKDRVCCLSDVVDAHVHLSPIGDIVKDEWTRTPTIRPNVELDEWVIMPNHIHGIIVITHFLQTFDTPEFRQDVGAETFQRNVSTASRLKPNSLSSIIGQIKSICTKRIRAAGLGDFDWQERFFDEIIRSEKALNRIRQYVVNNPANWRNDKDNPANLWM
jgi:putative transposase